MWIDIAIVLLLIISFLVGIKATRFILDKCIPKKVIVSVTFKDGQKKQYLVSSKEAQAINATANANKV